MYDPRFLLMSRINDMEFILRRFDIRRDDFLELVEVSRQTWVNWKLGRSHPIYKNWYRVEKAIEIIERGHPWDIANLKQLIEESLAP